MVIIDSIEKLYDKLVIFSELYDKVLLKDNVISISFHSDFVLRIEFDKYFNVYFNDIFYYNIDDQDILETLTDIIRRNHIFIERKRAFRGKVILVITEEEFNSNKEKWFNHRTTSIYSTEKLIFDNKNG